MTKEQGREFKQRWQAVNQVINDEIRRTPVDVKARQIAAAFLAARAFGFEPTPDQESFDRWCLLKEKSHAG